MQSNNLQTLKKSQERGVQHFISILMSYCSILYRSYIELYYILCLQAIMRPLSPKSGKVKVLLTIVSIWAISALLASPAGIFSKEVSTKQ